MKKQQKCYSLIKREQEKKAKRNKKVGLFFYNVFIYLAIISVSFLIMGFDSLADFIIK